MEQQPMSGSAPLEPPSSEIARLYLDEVGAVEQRREERIDRRAGAWHSIFTAAITAVMFTAYLLVMRVESSAAQPLLFLLILTSQISAGVGERNGVQWRLPRSNRWYVALIILFGVSILVSFFALLFSPDVLPSCAYLIPGAIMLLGFGGIGAIQLWKARGTARVHPAPPAPIPVATRIATASVGLLLGLSALSIGIRDDFAVSVVTIVMMMLVVAWLFAWRTDAGPAALGRYWRWPQITAFALTTGVIVWLSVQKAYAGPSEPSTYLIVAPVVAATLIGSALLPDTRSSRGAVDRDGDG